jgi:hypothetical protein
MSNPDRIALANALRDKIRELETEIEALAAELRHLLMPDEGPKDVER